MARCETVKIKHATAKDGFCIINKSDLDTSDELFEPDDSVVKVDPDAPQLGGDLNVNEPDGEVDHDAVSGEDFSDGQLRDAIKEVTGKTPHHKRKRSGLLAQFKKLNKEAAQ